jgi:hypothetical protein
MHDRPVHLGQLIYYISMMPTIDWLACSQNLLRSLLLATWHSSRILHSFRFSLEKNHRELKKPAVRRSLLDCLTRPMCPYAFYREEKQHHSPSQDPSSCRSWPENHASAEGLCGMDLRGEAQSCTSGREEVRGRRSLAGSKLGTSGCGGGACRLGAEHEQSRRRLGPEHERPRRGESDEAEGKQSGREKDQAEEEGKREGLDMVVGTSRRSGM